MVAISRRATASYPRSTWSLWMRIAATVVSAVTLGFPSRSAPTQLPHSRAAATRGGRVPVRPLSLAAGRSMTAVRGGDPERPAAGGSSAASSAR